MLQFATVRGDGRAAMAPRESARHMTRSDSRDTLPTIVFLSVSAPDGTTKFVDQIVTFAPDDIEFLYFSWRTALFGRWDVFHVHWPEYLVRGRTVIHRLRNRALFTALLMRLRLQRKPVLRTVHNLRPHEPGDRGEARLLADLDDATSMLVRLTDSTPVDADRPHTTILHGDYRYPFRNYGHAAVIPGRLLYFGRIEPYKGVDLLLEVFAALADDALSLRIVGRPTDSLRSVITAEADRAEAVTARLEFVSDQALVEEITASELIVLPYKEMHNSGVLLVALSLNRPVLAPYSSTNELIQVEVGNEWLILYTGEFTAEVLRDAMAAVRGSSRSATVEMPSRDWVAVAARYAAAYRLLAGRESSPDDQKAQSQTWS